MIPQTIQFLVYTFNITILALFTGIQCFLIFCYKEIFSYYLEGTNNHLACKICCFSKSSTKKRTKFHVQNSIPADAK